MALRSLIPVVFCAAVGGCASLAEPVLDADGCRPAMAIYQAAVGPGGAGQVIHIPRSCPAEVALTPATAESLMTGATAAVPRGQAVQAVPGPPREREAPPAPVDTMTAIRNGIEGFCGWFFGDQPYSLDGLRQAAFEAGYGRGAPVQIVPLPEMLREPAFSAVGFTAIAESRPSDDHGVAAFVSFHNPVCQIQVHGYDEEAPAVLAALEADGWRKVGPLKRGALWEAQRYQNAQGRPMTLVDNRLLDEAGSLRRVLNVVPGHDPDRGALE